MPIPMSADYQAYVEPYASSFNRIDVEPAYVARIEAFVGELIRRKSTEAHHRMDHNQEVKRFTTGFLGEAALEQLFGFPIIDWSIDDSKLYHHPDVPGYRIGIKTVEFGKFPVIFKKNDYPQIICIRYQNHVYVCGLATADVLNRYQNDDLIVDPRLRARGTKTGFYGFAHLQPVGCLADIAAYRR